MRTALKLAFVTPLLLIGACHSQSDQSTITNSVIDNTLGTASDEMTNIDATTGSAANMAADVPAGATDSAPAGADAGSGDAAQQDATPAPKAAHHAKPAKAPKLGGDTGN